jgi:hypothetical protein
VRVISCGLLLAVICTVLGCGGSSAPDAQRQPPSAVPRISPPPARSAPSNEPEPEAPAKVPAPRHPIGPWIEYQVANSDPITGKGYLRLLVAPGFETVLELSSYDTPDHEEFPSLHIRAVTKSEKLSELVQKKLPAELFLMIEKDGNIIHNQPTQAVEIVISEIDVKNVRGTFAGQVHDIDSTGDGPISGNFQAIVE